MSIGVIGAGVIGLTTAIVLGQRGHEVTVWAKDLHPDTTSSHAGSYWSPHPYPKSIAQRAAIVRWGEFSRVRIGELAADGRSGCAVVKVVRLEDHEGPDPWWAPYTPTFRPLPSGDLPAGYGKGYQFEGAVMDCTRYMPYLMRTVSLLGGTIVQRAVTDLAEPQRMFDAVVNCTGLGSRELVGDTSLFPVRGQVVSVRKNGLDHVIGDNLGHNALAYVVPRVDDIYMGGTTQRDDFDVRPRAIDTDEILRKCAELSPLFREVEILDVSVGLRPSRAQVRLELEYRNGRPLVHNYGHGGAGFALSWGCAHDVADLIASTGHHPEGSMTASASRGGSEGPVNT